MKRLAIVAAVLVIAACKAKDDTAADTSAVMTPAPMDSSMMSDSMKMADSMMMKDTTTKKP